MGVSTQNVPKPPPGKNVSVPPPGKNVQNPKVKYFRNAKVKSQGQEFQECVECVECENQKRNTKFSEICGR